MVFDMITNAPGVLVSTLQWGLLQNLSAATSDPNAVLSLNPTALRIQAAAVQRGTSACSSKLGGTSSPTSPTLGPKSDDLLRQVQINALPFGATLAPQNQDPTRAPSATPGVVGAAERPAAALSGLRQHPDVGLQRVLELPRAADVDNRRFDQGWSSPASTSGARRSPSTAPTFTPGCRT